MTDIEDLRNTMMRHIDGGKFLAGCGKGELEDAADAAIIAVLEGIRGITPEDIGLKDGPYASGKALHEAILGGIISQIKESDNGNT